jgi:hypothetical protein
VARNLVSGVPSGETLEENRGDHSRREEMKSNLVNTDEKKKEI